MLIRAIYILAFIVLNAGIAWTATLSLPLKGMKVCLDPGHGGDPNKLYNSKTGDVDNYPYENSSGNYPTLDNMTIGDWGTLNGIMPCLHLGRNGDIYNIIIFS